MAEATLPVASTSSCEIANAVVSGEAAVSLGRCSWAGRCRGNGRERCGLELWASGRSGGCGWGLRGRAVGVRAGGAWWSAAAREADPGGDSSLAPGGRPGMPSACPGGGPGRLAQVSSMMGRTGGGGVSPFFPMARRLACRARAKARLKSGQRWRGGRRSKAPGPLAAMGEGRGGQDVRCGALSSDISPHHGSSSCPGAVRSPLSGASPQPSSWGGPSPEPRARPSPPAAEVPPSFGR